MNRRLFLAGAVGALAAPKWLIAGEGTLDYTPGLINSKLAAGETVFVDFAASWCSTCKRQERVIQELRAANPAYDESISFVRVDWDEYGSHEVSTSRNIPRRSTLILLHGDEELGRIVAGTSADKIRALLDKGLLSS